MLFIYRKWIIVAILVQLLRRSSIVGMSYFTIYSREPQVLVHYTQWTQQSIIWYNYYILIVYLNIVGR